MWLVWILRNSLGASKNKNVTEFFLPGSICALAADKKSTDKFWCMKIEGEGVGPATDDYGFIIPEGCNHLLGRFLEKGSENNKLTTYKLINKIT